MNSLGASGREMSVMGNVVLPDDPQEAEARYMSLRQCVRETFQGFLRNIDSQSHLRFLESQFDSHGGCLDSKSFLQVFTGVFPQPQSEVFQEPEERRLIVQLAALMLFEGMDVDSSGEASWMEFVEFICAVAEQLRLQAMELSGQTFDFNPSMVSAPFRPTITKCHFDKLYHFPKVASDSVIIFEERRHSFHVHSVHTMARKRRTDEHHHHELLAAAVMEGPYGWVVTSANDKTMCFWDATFKMVKKWTLDQVVGSLCWCDSIEGRDMALYAGDYVTEPMMPKVFGWRLPDNPMDFKAMACTPKPDKALELRPNTHLKTVTVLLWLRPLQLLVTASMDATLQLFDLVQLRKTHVLAGHKKGVTCLVYCAMNQMLLSSGFDNYIAIWDPCAGSLLHMLSGHECSIVGICAMPETDYEIMSVDSAGGVRLWDVRRLQCLQAFNATDLRAEKAGDQEPLEARAICAISRDRVLITGRRMVVFDRAASEPRLTADFPINAIIFNHRKIEIVTPVKNDLYRWCALTGKLLMVHDNVTDGNITALALGLGERRIFVGADDGQINALNYDCGALLKSLSSHKYEVTQIECIPSKIVTLSSAERRILVHDDNESKKPCVLKTIDLSTIGAVLQFSHDKKDTIVAASEEGDVVWYNADFAKVVSNSADCEVHHEQAVSCCKYFTDAPLIVTADAESNVIFWSVPPLRTYEFFNKILLSLHPDDGGAPPAGPQASSRHSGAGTIAISSMALAWPDEDRLFVGTERGSLACINIKDVVDNARHQRMDILQRKESGEAHAVISGRIFESMPKPDQSSHYVFPLPNDWFVGRAHKGNVEEIVLCKRKPMLLLTLGIDICVRMWLHDTGEALGTLEQGLPEGLFYQRESMWRFALDAHEQVRLDIEDLKVAALGSEAPPPAEEEKVPEAVPAEAVPAQPRELGRARSQSKRIAKATSSPDLMPFQSPKLATPLKEAKDRRPPIARSETLPATPGLAKTPSRVFHKPLRTKEHDWFAGGLSHSPAAKAALLPQLQSGLRRPSPNESKAVVDAACRLSAALDIWRSSYDL